MRARDLIGIGAAVAAGIAIGCFNGSFNQDRRTQGGGGRLALVIEPLRTDVDGSHFLLDAATGDLWRLQLSGGSGAWVRVADGPADLQELEPPTPGPAGAEPKP